MNIIFAFFKPLRYSIIFKIIIAFAFLTLFTLTESGCNSPGQQVETNGISSTAMISSPEGIGTVTLETTPEVAPQPSPVDPLTDLVIEADMIVYGTITDLKYDAAKPAEGDFGGVYTIFTLSAEKVIKGEPDTEEVFVRVPGGRVNDEIWQTPMEGYPYFSLSDRILIFLQKTNDDIFIPLLMRDPDHVFNLFDGVLWEESESIRTTPELEDVIARIILIMKANNIPIALPAGEIPPMPTGPVHAPTKSALLNDTESESTQYL